MRVMILGGGHAGGATALALRELGCDGDVTVVGEEPTPPYERPPLSKEVLAGDMAAPPALAGDWAARRIRLRLGQRAVAIDRASGLLRLDDGSAEPFDRLVIATGGSPRRPPFPAHPRLLSLRRIEDAQAIRAAAQGGGRAAILGGGVIGLEVAASLRSVGLAVTVIEMASRVMGRNAPPDMAARIEALHREAGVELLLGRRVRAMRALSPARLACDLDDGRVLEADLVVLGIGIAPDTGLAEAAGLGGPDGVPVDGRYRTADPRILAVGDVASRAGRREETWAHAQASARAAARTILDLPEEAAPAPWFWTSQFGHTLQVAGDPLAADRLIARGPALSLYLQGDTLAGVAAFDAARDFAQARRMLGRRLDPQRAADRVLELRAALIGAAAA